MTLIDLVKIENTDVHMFTYVEAMNGKFKMFS